MVLRGPLWICAGLLLASCGGREGGQGPLAKVGEEAIEVGELRDYSSRLPESLRPTGAREQAVRDLLQSLVAGKVLLQEARAQGLEQDSVVQASVRRAVVRELIARVTQQDINPQVTVSEEQVRQRYREDHWDQVHHPAHILSRSEADAKEIVRRLRAGADFAQLARERSLAKADAGRGGDLGRYFGPGDVVPGIGQAVLGLRAGQIAGPVRTQDGWEVVKVLDVREVPFEAVQAKLAGALANKKRREVRLELVVQLEGKYGVEYDPAGVRAVQAPDRGLSAGAVPLIRYAGGIIPVGAPAVRTALLGAPAGLFRDSPMVLAVLRDRLVADSLLVFEARNRGLDQLPDIVALRDRVFRRAMVTELRRREVLERIVLTPEELREAYEKDQARYRLAPALAVREILVGAEAQADELRGRILAGESMADLAWTHSERSGAQQVEGRWNIDPVHPGEEWTGLLARFEAAPVGELVGPVAVPGGYSLFRVEERQTERIRSLEEVEHLVRHSLRGRKADRMFADYTRDLVARYAPQIVWYDSRIKQVASTW